MLPEVRHLEVMTGQKLLAQVLTLRNGETEVQKRLPKNQPGKSPQNHVQTCNNSLTAVNQKLRKRIITLSVEIGLARRVSERDTSFFLLSMALTSNWFRSTEVPLKDAMLLLIAGLATWTNLDSDSRKPKTSLPVCRSHPQWVLVMMFLP